MINLISCVIVTTPSVEYHSMTLSHISKHSKFSFVRRELEDRKSKIMTDRDFPSFCLMKLFSVITSDEIFFLFGRNQCYLWTDDTLSLISRNQLRITKYFLSLMSLMISFSIMISTNFILLLLFHTIEIIFKMKFVKYCFKLIRKMYMIYDDPARKRNKTKIQ